MIGEYNGEEGKYLLALEDKKKKTKTKHIYSCKIENKLIHRW